MRRSLLKALQGAAPAWSQASSSKQQCNQAALTAFSAVHLPFQRVDEQQEATAQHHQLRLLHASPSPSHSFPLLLTQRPGMASFLPSVAGQQLQQARTMAGPPASSETTVPENTWAKFRAGYGVEKRNDLAAGMYALILVFSLSALTHDIYACSPRVAAMTGFVFFLLYRRKGNA